jgi:hypothetical protein
MATGDTINPSICHDRIMELDDQGPTTGQQAQGRRQNVMVSQNRILTVSYGTFSCTLEGFDDPFGTMKAIAEYFRDLAAEDRYFGAEPPQPDAAMLHRIAEREIQRRVEAKIQDNGVILRAADLLDRPVPVARPQPAPEPVAPAPVVVETAEPAPRLLAVDDGVAAKLARIRAAVDRSRAAAPIADDIEDAEHPTDPLQVTSGLTDDLPEAEIDDLAWSDVPPAVVAAAAVADDGATAAAAAEDEFLEDIIADLAQPGTDPAAADIAEEPAPAADIQEAPPAALAEAASDDLPEVEAAPLAELPEAPAPQAVVAPEEARADPATVVAEPSPQSAGEPVAAPRQVSGWHLRRRQRRLNREAAAQAAQIAAPEAAAPVVPAADTPVQVSALVDPAQADDFDLDALEAALEGIEAEAAAEASPLAEPATALDADDADLDTLPAPDVATTDLSEDPTDADLTAEAPAPVAEAPALAKADPAPVQAAAPTSDDVDMLIARLAAGTPPAAAAVAPAPAAESVAEPAPRVRIVKVRRARLPEPEAIAADDTPEAPAIAELAEADEPVPAPIQDVLPDDLPEAAIEPVAAADVADLNHGDEPVAPVAPEPDAQALPVRPSRPVPARPVVQRAATQRPVAPRADVAVPYTGAPVSPARPVRPERVADRRGALEREGARGEAAVDRLLRQADTEMSEADTRRRTSTIAHLKAAVAATVAERLAPRGPDAPTEPDATSAYRNDLATAVRPRRPGDAESAAQSPAEQARVAPLVLVSAQRIDRPAPPQAQAPVAMPSRPRGAAVNALAFDDDDEDEVGTAEGAPGNLFGGIGAFPDWAQAAGAVDLADRLEAAAAWLMEAEGLDGFNRPQLMRVAAADEAAESREAAMAAFGALLRDGRIVKSRRGIFTLPASSPALAKARKAAR